MIFGTQVWDKGTVNQSRIVIYSAGLKTYINYTSKSDNKAHWATFDDVAIVLKDDTIRLNPPPSTMIFSQTDYWKDIKDYLREKYDLTIDLDKEPPSDVYPTEVNFFLAIKPLTGQKAREIEDITRAITYTH